jgi:hypothetical protein
LRWEGPKVTFAAWATAAGADKLLERSRKAAAGATAQLPAGNMR